MDVVGREKQVRHFVDEVWNARNYAAAADLYDASYASPFGVGPSARVEPIRRYHQAFPDLRMDVEEVIVTARRRRGQNDVPGHRHGGIRGTGTDGPGRGRMGRHHHALRR